MRPKQFIIALGLAIALTSTAGASIGIRHDTLRNYQGTLTRHGWKVRSGSNLKDVERTVPQMIDDVLATFAKEDVAKVTAETKRAVARIAQEAITRGVSGDKTNLQTGITGSLRYRVGVFRYKTYYGPGTGAAAREEWDRRGQRDEQTGLAPLIALMPKEPARSAIARIVVRSVPEDAELFFEGELTTQKGIDRLFTTPALEVGTMYDYTIRVRWRKDGKTLE